MCRHLIFLHAFTGCDSSSFIYGIDKPSAFNKLVNIKNLKEAAHTFSESNGNLSCWKESHVVVVWMKVFKNCFFKKVFKSLSIVSLRKRLPPLKLFLVILF